MRSEIFFTELCQISVLNIQAGRPGLPPLKSIGRSNNNTGAVDLGVLVVEKEN